MYHQLVKPATKTIYFGTVVDSHWDKQIGYVINKLTSMIHKFNFLSQLIPIHFRKTLYFALVVSHLIYGVLAWRISLNCYLNMHKKPC